MKKPLVLYAIFFMSGIAIANAFPVSLPIAYVIPALILLLCIVIYRLRFFGLFMMLLAFTLGILILLSFNAKPGPHITTQLADERSYTVLQGTISGDTLIVRGLNIRGRFQPCYGNVLLKLSNDFTAEEGREVLVRGKIYKTRGYTQKKNARYFAYLYNQGIDAVITVENEYDLAYVSPSKTGKFNPALHTLRESSEGVINGYLTQPAAGVLDAMVLGEKRSVPVTISRIMMQTGTIHILVVSGFNVAIVGFVFMLALKILRIHRRLRIICVLPLLILYCLITGASTPVLRATVMAAVFLFAFLFKREADTINCLAISALAVLVNNPRQLFDCGFQLSFASVLGIVIGYRFFSQKTGLEKWPNPYLRWLAGAVFTSFSAWIGTVFIIAYHFRMVSLVAILANIIIAPLASCITVCGLILLIAAWLVPASVVFCAVTCEWLVTFLLLLHKWFVLMPGAYVNF